MHRLVVDGYQVLLDLRLAIVDISFYIIKLLPVLGISLDLLVVGGLELLDQINGSD